MWGPDILGCSRRPLTACLVRRATSSSVPFLRPAVALALTLAPRPAPWLCQASQSSLNEVGGRKRRSFSTVSEHMPHASPTRDFPRLQPTISDVLRLALRSAGAIAETNWAPLTRTKWTLASRTDKGVHAAGAAISFRMETLESQLARQHDSNRRDARPLRKPRDRQLPTLPGRVVAFAPRAPYEGSTGHCAF